MFLQTMKSVGQKKKVLSQASLEVGDQALWGKGENYKGEGTVDPQCTGEMVMEMEYNISPPCLEVGEHMLPIHVAISKVGGGSDSKGVGMSGGSGGSLRKWKREGRKGVGENVDDKNGTGVLGKRKMKRVGNEEEVAAGDEKRIKIMEDKAMAVAGLQPCQDQ
jgi:hypothetical protein